jgi:hypothetical protein
MICTGYTWPSTASVATGYQRSPRLVTPTLKAVLPGGIVGQRLGRYQALRPFLVNGPGYGGLVGDVTDAARLAALHLGNGSLHEQRVLSNAAAQRMRSITTEGHTPSTSASDGSAKPTREIHGQGSWSTTGPAAAATTLSASTPIMTSAS